MITTAEEFVRLRESNDPRATRDSAPDDVWSQVLQTYPDMKEWVVLNKNVPLPILRILAKDPEFRVRHAVAMKRKCDAEMLEALSCDRCEGVRLRVALNPSTPAEIIKKLAADKYVEVAEAAKERLRRLAK